MDEALVPLDLSDAIAMIERQKERIAALEAENKRLREGLLTSRNIFERLPHRTQIVNIIDELLKEGV